MIQNQFPVRGVPGSAVSVLLPPAELWVPPRTQLSPEVPRGGPALFSSCRRGICRPCRSRSQRSCRRHQTGRERPAVSRGEEEPRSHQQGPPAPPGSGPALGEGGRRSHAAISRALPLLLGQDQPWENSSPLRQIQKPQLPSSGPRKEDPLPRENPRHQTQPRLTRAWDQVYVLNPKRHHVPSGHQSLVAPSLSRRTRSWSCCPLNPWVRGRTTVWCLGALRFRMEAKGA